ncbi:hypothetical protein [Glycomyces tenuis]|uniref:hypothetical protein n=1 Tax=Glycomyces tenuis TaxID=58116 RepID=UPI0003FB835D|nr:hypothetical protein [Glycomyces tenuis]
MLDLRECLGGDPDTVALVCSYLFDERVHLNDVYEREGDRATQSWTQPYVPGRRFGAGEAQGLGRVADSVPCK